MFSKRYGFSILELLLVLAITGLLIICMTPALTRKQTPPDVTQKITCIKGARYVVQNLFVPDEKRNTPVREGRITLPPGLTSFVLTMSAGGAGGCAAYIDNGNDGRRNLGGCGGGGGEFVYKLNVSFTPADSAEPVVVTYHIGGGGAGGVSDSSDVLYGDYNDETIHVAYDPLAGGASSLSISNILIDKDHSCPDNFTPGSSTCTLSLAGGKAPIPNNDADPVASDKGSPIYGFREGVVDKSKNYGEFFQDPVSEEAVKIFYNRRYGTPGGTSSDLTRGIDIEKRSGSVYFGDKVAGQQGEAAIELLPGLGGGSVFGAGSFGSGGAGGLNALEKRFNIKRGETNFRRSGEDGGGGIMILEFDSVCTNRR